MSLQLNQTNQGYSGRGVRVYQTHKVLKKIGFKTKQPMVNWTMTGWQAWIHNNPAGCYMLILTDKTTSIAVVYTHHRDPDRSHWWIVSKKIDHHMIHGMMVWKVRAYKYSSGRGGWDVSTVRSIRGYGRGEDRSETADGYEWIRGETTEAKNKWKKGKNFAKDEIYGSYETCLTARSHSSDVKRTLVSQDWISRKTSILTSGFYQTRHLRASYGYLFFKMASSLDAFSSYPLPRGYSACLVRQLIN